ncbi:MAG: carboxypeptidase regulatory-like domain-containing protein [Bryobacterales bacterium]|nr:carboxypeptidase regulatory-like domain-containing protein [Bryobacterales bacterium]
MLASIHTRVILACLVVTLFATGETVDATVTAFHTDLPVDHAKGTVLDISGAIRAVVETDANGAFRAGGLTPGRYRLEITKPGYTPALVFFSVPSALDKFRIRLAKYGVISGMVRTAAGAPAAGASVVALITPPNASSLVRSSVAPARTDDRGHYRLHGLPPGAYTLVAIRSDSRGGGSAIPVSEVSSLYRIFAGEEYRNVDLSLRAAGAHSLAGRVSPPAPGGVVMVSLAPRELPGVVIAHAPAHADGSFRFESVPAEPLVVRAAGSFGSLVNGVWGVEPIAPPLYGSRVLALLHPGDELAVPLSGPATTAFRLDFPGPTGECPPSATLHLAAIDSWGGNVDREVQIEAGAPVRISGLAPGRYLAKISGLPASCHHVGDPVVDLEGTLAETLVIRLASAASVEGGVDRNEGLPVVLLWAEGASGLLLPDGQGRFFASGLRPGEYRFLIVPPSAWADGRGIPSPENWPQRQLPAGVSEWELLVSP